MGGRLDATNVAEPARLRHRDRRPRPRGLPGHDPRRHRAREGGRAAARARHRAGPAGRRGARGRSREAADARRRAARGRARRRASRGARRTASTCARRAARIAACARCPARTSARTWWWRCGCSRRRAAAGLALRPRRAVARASPRTRWPGRLQRIPGGPPLLLDGAHNPAGARAPSPRTCAAQPPFVLVFGGHGATRTSATHGRAPCSRSPRAVVAHAGAPGARAAAPADDRRAASARRGRAARASTDGRGARWRWRARLAGPRRPGGGGGQPLPGGRGAAPQWRGRPGGRGSRRALPACPTPRGPRTSCTHACRRGRSRTSPGSR